MKKSVGIVLISVLISTVVVLASCTAKSQDVFPPQTVKAFSDAGLQLLKQKALPRDFALPAASSTVPQTLAKPVTLSGLKGKVVFLNFWATWCGPCRSEMPSIQALYDKYKDRGLEILAVNGGEKASDVLAFMNENKLSFPAVLDSDNSVNRSWGVQAIPTSYLIDRDGMIILRIVGSIDWNTPQIQAALETLL